MKAFDVQLRPYTRYDQFKHEGDLKLLPEKYKDLDFNINNSLIIVKNHDYLGGKDFTSKELNSEIINSSLSKISINANYEVVQIVKIDNQLFINPWFKQPDFLILEKVILETEIPIGYEKIINNLNKLLTPNSDSERNIESNPIVITSYGISERHFPVRSLASVDYFIIKLKESSIGIYLENN